MSTRFLHALQIICALFAGFVFVFFPTRIVEGPLAALGLTLLTKTYIVLAVFLLGLAAVLKILEHLYRHQTTVSKIEKQPPQPFGYRDLVLLVLGGALIYRAVAGIYTPMEPDEYGTLQKLLAWNSLKDWMPRMAFDFSKNQYVSDFLTYVSLKIFGQSLFALRLPSVLLTGILATAFYFAYRLRMLSFFVSALCLGHLISNETFVWYSHCSKGIVSMALFTYLFFLVIHSRISWVYEKPLAFCTLLFAMLLTHSFASFFFAFAVVSFSLWVVTQKNPPAEKVRGSLYLFRYLLLFTPLMIVIFATQTISMDSNNDFFSVALKPNYTFFFSSFFGLNSSWTARFAVAGFIALLATVSAQSLRKYLKWNFFLILTSLLGFTFLIATLDPKIILARYFMAFLIPVIVLVAEFVEETKKAKTAFVVWMVTALCVLPLTAGHALYPYFTQRLEPFSKFVAQVKERVPADQYGCLRYGGDQFLTSMAQESYFFAQPKDKCPNEFLIFIASDYYLSDALHTPPKTATIDKLLLKDEFGHRLYAFKN